MDLSQPRSENSNVLDTAELWLEDLMNEYGNALVNLVFTYVKDWGKAQEIVQDVFVTCYDHYENHKQITSYKAWVYRIAINRAKDATRTAWFRRVLVLNNFFSHIQSKQPSPEKLYENHESQSKLVQAVLSLPLKYREVVLLYYYEELSIKEISNVLNKNQNTIKSRLMRARESLRMILEGSDLNG
ncbi:sigma-70 family RNA polymerase sigma factor [Ureibacillus manganicus]|uniref:sigma-70 family RNA polymerase sigma factor n=1 Tax=Ureibacillus manganicus TaxID=1266064 RepID=UPI000691A9E8|nr:sigma-70 family RNA polymerase sigma factor [Ureibacillus manganicus]